MARIVKAVAVNSNAQIDIGWLASQFLDLHNLVPIGQGGQKIVLSAEHASDGDVVLKLIHPGQDIERTNRELIAIAEVNSPRVPRVYDRGQLTTNIGACVWFREQRISGETVRARLQGGPLEPSEVLTLGLHVLEALADAESASIVHRDVKPDNVMRDTAGTYWLLDFGLARHLTMTSLTATASPFGQMTIGYAPPEQCRNAKAEIDGRADLFAIGVTLYECATGQNPFWYGARDPREVLARVESQPLSHLSLPIAAAQSFGDLVSAMTQKRRDHRPATVREALDWMRDVCRAEGLF